METKDPEWYALRKVIIEFLEDKFKSYKEEGGRIYFDCTNEKIARDLGFTPSHIGRFLMNPELNDRPPGKKALYNLLEKVATYQRDNEHQEAIADKQQEIETLKQEIEKRPKQTDIDKVTEENTTLKKENENLKTKITHYKRWMYVGTVLTIFIAWFCSGVFLVQNKTTMNNVASWHGENIINQIVLEGLELNRRVKEGEITLKNKSDTLKEERELIREISAIIYRGRVELDAIGFFMLNGDKMGECINRFIPYKDKDGKLILVNPLIEEAVHEIIPKVLDPHIKTGKLTEQIKTTVLLKQHSLWEAMEACFRPFSRPRPLKTPSKD